MVFSTASDSSRPGQLLFRGLRVRVAISTGVCVGGGGRVEPLCGAHALPCNDLLCLCICPAIQPSTEWTGYTFHIALHSDKQVEDSLRQPAKDVSGDEAQLRPRLAADAVVRVLCGAVAAAGIPSLVYAHELTNTLMYAGPVMDMAAALADLPAGGQVGGTGACVAMCRCCVTEALCRSCVTEALCRCCVS